MDVHFEKMSKEVLADTLHEFYPSTRQAPEKAEHIGKPYVKQSLINIRSSINRFLQLPPHNKPWHLMKDKEFLAANRVFKGNFSIYLIKNKRKLPDIAMLETIHYL